MEEINEMKSKSKIERINPSQKFCFVLFVLFGKNMKLIKP